MKLTFNPPAVGQVRIEGLTASQLASLTPPGRGLILGVTGGIGCGKSAVTATLARLGAVVADADKLGHDLLHADTEAGKEIIARFNVEVAPSGEISRPSLAAAVFGNKQAVADLNAITHPRIRAQARQILAAVPDGGLGVYDAALIIEGGMKDMVDALMVVTAPEEKRLHLLQQHRGIARAEALARIGHQMPESERFRHADVAVYNYGSLPDLQAGVRAWGEDVLAALH
ncbi:MAG: dephospho-CoA kinase [Actinomycetaceae bacterium]|nr:dephospho-CoA kinase [Actinomycetaceae bacterium]